MLARHIDVSPADWDKHFHSLNGGNVNRCVCACMCMGTDCVCVGRGRGRGGERGLWGKGDAQVQRPL